MGTREIKFRGKCLDNGEWVYGDLGHRSKVTEYGLSPATTVGRYDVDPATVGQFTGCHDCDGNEIFEGDIVKNESAGFCGVIKFKDSAFIIDIDKIKGTLFACLQTGSLEIIGNIHDNPELLKGGEE